MSDIPFIDDIDKDTVLRYGLGGLLAGGGVASALDLAHMLRKMREEAEKDEEPSETDENTIVLTLPKKKEASAGKGPGGHVPDGTGPHGKGNGPGKGEGTHCDGKAVHTDIKVTEERTTAKDIHMGSQVKHYDGKYGSKIKEANWQTLVASVLAGAGGGALGYSMLDSLYEREYMKKKEEELEKAKQEYLDALRPDTAQPLLPTDDEQEEDEDKEASDRTFDTMDYPLGMAALALLLGTGGTAWLTKRVLDENSESVDKKVKTPEINRIVFKTAGALRPPETEEEKSAAEIGSCLINTYLDLCSGSPDIIGDEKVAAALNAVGMRPIDMYKAAASDVGSEDFQNLVATLDANPELRKTIERLGMEKHPIMKYFKWTSNMPILSGIYDKKLYNTVNALFGPEGEPKTAGVMDSYVGSTLAAKAINHTLDSARNKDDEEEDSREDKRTPEEILKSLSVEAADPEAKAFIQDNADKLRAVLTLLANRGDL